MMREYLVACTLGLSSIALVACTSQPAAPSGVSASSATDAAAESRAGGPRDSGGVYVISQGMCYDTFVAKDPLPMEGKFQLLENGRTQYGPGDAGYLGGRWWEDVNGNEMQDEGDHFFLCPLLPPGRPAPSGTC